jgi:two-component system, chemotaxis family, CheB/CheR fusion protein
MRLRTRKVLLVEDAPEIRDAFTLLLRAEGADVTATATGREALDCVAQTSFDVLLTDLGLPDIPGDVLIRQILTTASGRPRVVVVTGYSEPYISRARAAGADVVFTKPIEWNVLVQELLPDPRKPVAAA